MKTGIYEQLKTCSTQRIPELVNTAAGYKYIAPKTLRKIQRRAVFRLEGGAK